MREELGQQLRKTRTASGLSLEATSQAAKISQGYLHKLEAGRVENPSPRVLQRLSGVLGVSYGRLMRLADYLLPDQEAPLRAEEHSREELDMTTKTLTEAPPTNHELARLLEAVLSELAEVRRSQDDLAKALRRIPGRED